MVLMRIMVIESDIVMLISSSGEWLVLNVFK